MKLRSGISLLAAAFTFAVMLLVCPNGARATNKYRVLHNFGAAGDGSLPSGPLVVDARGNVYGATSGGDTGCKGSGSGGTVFELEPQASGRWQETVLYCFAGQWTDGFPDSGVAIGINGALYGTSAGGVNDLANVYQLTPAKEGWTFSVLYNLGGSCVVPGRTGNLYGCLGPGQFQAGAIAELVPGSGGWNYTELYSFCSDTNCPAGDGPYSPLSWDMHGNLYGTTLYGGTDYPKCPWSGGCGVAFRMTPNSDGTWTYDVLHLFASFRGDGERPYAGLVVDVGGNAYGTAWAGGPNGSGTIFKLTPTGPGWKQTTLYDFPNCAEGCGPTTTLALDKAGSLYGSGAGGNPDCGSYSCGTIFKLTPQTNGQWKYSVIHKFVGKDGAFPYGVIVDDKGNVFGTTEAGGTYNTGVAFEITP
jgi:uncharacterized repeat protein (TIGR03803 family)